VKVFEKIICLVETFGVEVGVESDLLVEGVGDGRLANSSNKFIRINEKEELKID
jgi:hypothetical protein